MLIGILTWFNNLNYGTVLQLLAMNDYLTAHFDCDIEVINYLPREAHEIAKKETLTDHPLHRGLLSLKKRLRLENGSEGDFNGLSPEELQKKKKRFETALSRLHFSESVKEISELTALAERYDLIICGSDQVWNPRILNSVYYLDFAQHTPKLS